MGKKIVIIGVGAQGSTIAKRLDEDPVVSEIVCADYDFKAAKSLEDTLTKAKAVQVDARDVKSVIAVAEGADLIVNGCTTDFNFTIMEAALAVDANYQDMAGPYSVGDDYVAGYKNVLLNWSKMFEDKGLTALIGTGSAPGLSNVMTREAVDRLDTVDTIEIHIYDAVVSKKHVLFWWSPEIALGDMCMETYSYIDGKIVEGKPFNRPVMMKFRGIDEEICMFDHAHDEPVSMGLLADKYLKGVKNISFKYGGPSVIKSQELYKMGLLSHEPIDVKGVKVAPFDVIIAASPPAPKYPEEIRAIIDEGMVSEDGAFLARVIGTRDGKDVTIDAYAIAPGLQEAFEKSGLSHESYSTGQCAAVFTKTMVNDVITAKGAVTPEALNSEARKYYFDELAKLGVTVEFYED
ncbi:MAG: saccharopine dehydrogenase NADP-binding domain-containing protein [Desulfobacterales bacterium]|nr:saccharopine dehydrogenase NADP-binding domain-containing protein [Desulfobacterales bacterium]